MSSDKIVAYKKNHTRANLRIEFETGRKSVFKKLSLRGNKKTAYAVVARENFFRRGDIVTPRKLNGLNNRLAALDIFERVEITPRATELPGSNTDEIELLVRVREKKFGHGEIAPGFRTDLGTKISFKRLVQKPVGKKPFHLP